MREYSAFDTFPAHCLAIIKNSGITGSFEMCHKARFLLRVLSKREECLRTSKCCPALKGLFYVFLYHKASVLYRSTEAAIPTAVPADRSKGEKHITREGDDAGLHEKRYSSYLLKGNAVRNCPE
jgi:hypothetical protein